MKKNVILPFCGNIATLWKAYLISVAEYFNKKIQKLGLGEAYCLFNSIGGDGSINTEELDWITIDDDGIEEVSKKVFIHFNVDLKDEPGDSKIQFEFMEGQISSENEKYHEVSELYFSPEILAEDKLFNEFISFITLGKINEDFFLKHKLVR